MFNVHASGGFDMMKAAADAVKETAASEKPIILAVTVLTSLDQEALARMEMVRYDFRNRRNDLLALAEKTLIEYRDAGRKIDLYVNNLISKTEQLLNVTFTAYQAGETDFLNVISVQRRLLDLQVELEKARVTEAKKLAELELLTGREIE